MENRIRMVSLMALTGALLLAANAGAAGPCQANTECDGDALCVNGECAVPEDGLSACSSELDCDIGLEAVCDEGFCKAVGVVCENPAGVCHMGDDWTECACEDGTGFGSGSVDPDTDTGGGGDSDTDGPALDGGAAPDPLPPDVNQECMSMLVDGCGTEAPDITDHCDEQELAACDALLDIFDAAEAACGQNGGDVDVDVDADTDMDTGSDGDEPPADQDAGPAEGDHVVPYDGDLNGHSFSEMRGCCGALRDEEEAAEMQAAAACLAAAGTDCEKVEECWPDDVGGADGDADMDGDGDGDDQGDGESKDEDNLADAGADDAPRNESSTESAGTGCSLAHSGADNGSILSLLSVLF